MKPFVSIDLCMELTVRCVVLSQFFVFKIYGNEHKLFGFDCKNTFSKCKEKGELVHFYRFPSSSYAIERRLKNPSVHVIGLNPQ